MNLLDSCFHCHFNNDRSLCGNADRLPMWGRRLWYHFPAPDGEMLEASRCAHSSFKELPFVVAMDSWLHSNNVTPIDGPTACCCKRWGEENKVNVPFSLCATQSSNTIFNWFFFCWFLQGFRWDLHHRAGEVTFFYQKKLPWYTQNAIIIGLIMANLYCWPKMKNKDDNSNFLHGLKCSIIIYTLGGGMHL